MVRIVAINGSHRGARGHTRFLVDRLLDGAVEAGAQGEVIDLARRRIRRCTGCQLCHTERFLLTCPFGAKDDVGDILDTIESADMVIYATPVYVFGMSGLLKTFLDRFNSTGDPRVLTVTKTGLFFHHIRPEICSKPFVSLVCCDNVEHAATRNVDDYFAVFSRFMDAPRVGRLVRTSGELLKHGRDPRIAERLSRAGQVYSAYHQAGRELAQQGRISRRTQHDANREVVPVPGFAIISRLPLRRVKQRILHKANTMMTAT